MFPIKTSLLLLLLAVGFSCSRPIANFSYTGDLKAPAELTFVNESSNADSFEWQFGADQSSTAQTPVYTFPAAGNYLVRLVARKGKKTATYTERIVVEGPDACLVELQTSFGNMIIELYNETPIHQANFLKLVEEGFYDDLLFHRVIQGFMIQGGDPDSRNARPGQRLGMGGPGYTIPAEFVDSLVHIKGALAAARTGDAANPQRRSSGSQFYIVQGGPVNASQLMQMEASGQFRYPSAQKKAYQEEGGTPQLDQSYTVFGRVIEGLEVIDKIAAQATDQSNRPRTDIPMKMKVINYFPEKINP